jgi:hypothetical protein
MSSQRRDESALPLQEHYHRLLSSWGIPLAVENSQLAAASLAIVDIVVKALRYKPEGRGFDNRRAEFLNLSNPSGRTRPWGFTQPLTEMSTRNIKMFLESKARPVSRDDNLTAICEPIL